MVYIQELLFNITISKISNLIFSFSTNLIGNVRLESLFLWYPFNYTNLKNNVIKDPFNPSFDLDVGANYSTTNTFNFPIYNYDKYIDWMTIGGDDPGLFTASVTLGAGLFNSAGIFINFINRSSYHNRLLCWLFTLLRRRCNRLL